MTLHRAAALLRGWDHLLILTHRRPDGDTIGCAAALCRGLRALGKTCFVLENPDLTARLAPYLEGCLAPEGYAWQRMVAVDTGAVQQLPPAQQELAARTDLLVDHHRSGGFGEHRLIFPESAACGEIVYDLLEALGVVLTPEIALPLYLAISTDTGCYRFSNTTARTHEITARLMETGFDFFSVNFEQFEKKSRARIGVEAAVFGGMELSAGGALCIMAVTRDLREKTGATTDDLDNISMLSRQMSGVMIGITLREEEPDNWKVSVRTMAPYQANDICAVLGGGGHVRASGCQISGKSLAEAAELLKGAVRSLYPEMG